MPHGSALTRLRRTVSRSAAGGDAVLIGGSERKQTVWRRCELC